MPNLPKLMHVGPGGTDCPCCFPQNRRLRRATIRAARRRAKREAISAEQEAYGTEKENREQDENEEMMACYPDGLWSPTGEADQETLALFGIESAVKAKEERALMADLKAIENHWYWRQHPPKKEEEFWGLTG